MKITRDFLIDVIQMNRVLPKSESLITIIAHPVGENYEYENFSWGMTEDLLGTVSLPAVNNLMGLSLHCELTTEPLTESGLNDPFTLILIHINQSQQFAFGEGVHQNRTIRRALDLATSSYIPEGLIQKDQDPTRRATCYINLSLSLEEYAEFEKLEADQCFKMSVKATG